MEEILIYYCGLLMLILLGVLFIFLVCCFLVLLISQAFESNG